MAMAIHHSAEWLRRRTRPPEPTSVSFPELVAARFRWQNEVRSTDPSERPAEFNEALAAFKHEHGEILEAHWCTHKRAAVALTLKSVDGIHRFVRPKPVLRLHALTAEATKHAPEVSAGLHRLQILSVRVNNVLRGMPAHVAMQRIVFAMGHLLTAVDVPDDKEPPGGDALVDRKAVDRDARDIEQYYHRAAVRAARITFFCGMLIGLVGLIGVSVAAWLGLDHAGLFDGKSADARTVVLCIAMGAIGALVSLMSRTAARRVDGPDLDYELGRDTLKWMGSFRPVVGATFGVVLFFGIRSGVLPIDLKPGQQNNATFALLAFLAGFSERWARGLVGGAGADLSKRSFA